jgi:signal transduction histidine kinase
MWGFARSKNESRDIKSYSQLETLILERTAALQSLSQRVLRAQDEERRRVARDLHDSTGQTLSALKITVTLLQCKLGNDPGTEDELSEIARLADAALQGIRTTSYLLHPPLLDEAGFVSAARWYLEGFARRSGMTVRMNFTREAERLPDIVEIALFRVLQESLTNVHRHAGTSEVDVSFRREDQAGILEVRDYGRGIPRRVLSRFGTTTREGGVGLAGMRERLTELRGELEINLADPGTRLRAIVPCDCRNCAPSPAFA